MTIYGPVSLTRNTQEEKSLDIKPTITHPKLNLITPINPFPTKTKKKKQFYSNPS